MFNVERLTPIETDPDCGKMKADLGKIESQFSYSYPLINRLFLFKNIK